MKKILKYSGTINSYRKCKKSIPALRGKDGEIYTDDLNKSNIIIDFFSSAFITDDMNNIPTMTPGDKSKKRFYFWSSSIFSKCAFRTFLTQDRDFLSNILYSNSTYFGCRIHADCPYAQNCDFSGARIVSYCTCPLFPMPPMLINAIS